MYDRYETQPAIGVEIVCPTGRMRLLAPMSHDAWCSKQPKYRCLCDAGWVKLNQEKWPEFLKQEQDESYRAYFIYLRAFVRRQSRCIRYFVRSNRPKRNGSSKA